MRCRRSAHESGAAVVDFVLVSMILVPLFLGLVQVGLVLYVRNVVAAAAAEGARAGAGQGQDPDDGVRRTRDQLAGVVSERFLGDVVGRETTLDGVAVVEVRVRAQVPPLGLWGPSIVLELTAHAVREGPP